MLQFFLWYITITLLGLLTFPLTYRLLPALADRGYSLSRALGLLLWGFIFWLSVSFGIVRNEIGGLLFTLVFLIFVIAGLFAYSKTSAGKSQANEWEKDQAGAIGQVNRTGAYPQLPDLRTAVRSFGSWLKTNLRLIFFIEVLFIVAFAAWAFVRAGNPETTGTEKPMEVAFINAILHSPGFPPSDPWLSGYGISYYYFGYVLAAMLAMVTNTNGGMTFNLMLSLIFALSVIGSFGLLYNLLSAYWYQRTDSRCTAPPIPGLTQKQIEQHAANIPLSVPGLLSPPLSATLFGALSAPLFLLIIGNVEGFLELLHAYGIGWARPAAASNFWLWLNMKDLSEAPTAPFVWNPRFWFWWRASRILHDYDLRGNFVEIIDEFPFFSYLLGDLHPHVLAMPFGLLAAALALNLYLGGWQGQTNIFGLKMPIQKQGFVLLAIVLGGLAFLNTWDFPIYLAIVSAAFLLGQFAPQSRDFPASREYRDDVLYRAGAGTGAYPPDVLTGSKSVIADPTLDANYPSFFDNLKSTIQFSIPLALASIVLYLPFYLSFSSQAGGILPNVIFPTRGVYLWIMFATLLIPIIIFLISLYPKHPADWKTGFLLSIGLTLALWAFSIVMGLIAGQTDVGFSFITSQGFTSTRDVLYAATLRRLQYGGGLLTLILLIGAVLAYLRAVMPNLPGYKVLVSTFGQPSPLPFVLMFILFGGLLVLLPEFVYLRDQFGTRMNTVFKFYYQAWTLWSIAAAFGFIILMRELRGLKLALFMAVMSALLLVGLTYPALSLPNKIGSFNPANLTLDGAAYLQIYNPDDYAAIQWLTQAQTGVVAEAVGGSYSEFARMSTYSGQVSVLGWPGHESQWRGGSAEMNGRADDLGKLYTTSSWAEAKTILKRYNIRYVIIGRLERATYRVDERKFSTNLSEVYKQGQVVIYEVP